MNSLKKKTLIGLGWSFAGNFANQAVTFIVGIILARLLTPHDYGLIGLTTIFLVISQTFIDSGFRQSLIRKISCTQDDYSTVFHFNLIIGLFLYLLLFISSGSIARLFNEPDLKPIIRVIGTTLMIGSSSIIQSTILTKQINFKLQSGISFFSALISGTLGILLAYKNFGVWSLVVRQVAGVSLNTLLLWVFGTWKPSWQFSISSFRELFGFGGKLLLTQLLDQIFYNLYYFIIGKFYTAQNLGFYTRAEMFKNLISQNVTLVVSNVAYPVLSELDDNRERQKTVYKEILMSTNLITMGLSLLMIAVAEPLIYLLIGEKWTSSIEMLQLLCIAGIFTPSSYLNTLVLKTRGNSRTILIIEIIKKTLTVPVIIIGIFWGIQNLIIGLIFISFIDFLITGYIGGGLIKYKFQLQIRDSGLSFVLSIIMAIAVHFIGTCFKEISLFGLIIQITSGGLIWIGLNEMLRNPSYLSIKTVIKETIGK